MEGDERALRRLHTALWPGGRFAVAVWAPPDRVAFATPVAVMIEALGIEPPAGPGVGAQTRRRSDLAADETSFRPVR